MTSSSERKSLRSLHHAGQQVVPRIGAAGADDRAEELDQAGHRGLTALQSGGVLAAHEDDRAEVIRPRSHFLAGLRGDPEILRDDDDRQLERELGEEVHTVPAAQRLCQLADQFAHPGPQLLHAARGESLVDQRPHVRVVRLILPDEELRQEAEQVL